MTDNEIIKALETCCSRNNCEKNCPYALHKDCFFKCIEMCTADTIDLIKRQQAEIEELREINKSRKEERPLLIYTARAEAIKEFAEKLKEFRYMANVAARNTSIVVNVKDIDDLVKEMVGADNA